DGLGPVTVAQLAVSSALPNKSIDQALARLEGEGFAMQGQFSPGGTQASSPANNQEARGDARVPMASSPANGQEARGDARVPMASPANNQEARGDARVPIASPANNQEA